MNIIQHIAKAFYRKYSYVTPFVIITIFKSNCNLITHSFSVTVTENSYYFVIKLRNFVTCNYLLPSTDHQGVLVKESLLSMAFLFPIRLDNNTVCTNNTRYLTCADSSPPLTHTSSVFSPTPMYHLSCTFLPYLIRTTSLLTQVSL